MRKILIFFFATWSLVFASLLLFSGDSEADSLFELQQVALTYRSFFDGGVDPLITENPYLPNRAMGKELNLNVDTNILNYFYWNSVVHSMTDHEVGSDSGQFRMVGLEFGLGLDVRRIWEGLPVQVGYHHQSLHTLDSASPYHFPVQDSVELKIFVYERRTK